MMLRELADHFARLDLDAAGTAALTTQAAEIADAVRSALSHPPGGSHEYPWLRSGSLSGSIAIDVSDGEALIASTSDVALYQERGTVTAPPRPFLGPIAAALSEAVADAIGHAIAAAVSP